MEVLNHDQLGSSTLAEFRPSPVAKNSSPPSRDQMGEKRRALAQWRSGPLGRRSGVGGCRSRAEDQASGTLPQGVPGVGSADAGFNLRASLDGTAPETAAVRRLGQLSVIRNGSRRARKRSRRSEVCDPGVRVRERCQPARTSGSVGGKVAGSEKTRPARGSARHASISWLASDVSRPP